MKTKTVDEYDDRLSELPDSLILEILSLLPMRDAVKTTILSKSWTDLWTTIPCLNFKLPTEKIGFWTKLIHYYLDLEEEEEKKKKKKKKNERKFINEAQKHWKGISIRKFEVSFIDDQPSCVIDSWLRFATEKKVQDLCLNLPLRESPVLLYSVPQCIYSCSSITKLRISGCTLGIQQNVIKWDNLKTLFLQGGCFGEDVITQLVSSAPRLESLELHLDRSRHSLNIQSNSLKTLTVDKYNDYYQVQEYDPSLTIRAPQLRSLHLSGNAYTDCNYLLTDGASSLARAILCFYDNSCTELEETLKQIIPAIKHVDEVTLSPCAFKMLTVMLQTHSLPPFLNAKKLRLLGGPVEPKEITGIAQIFPRVERLNIDWKLDDWYPLFLENLSKNSTYAESLAKSPNCFWKQLKTVKVEVYNGWSNLETALPLIEFLTENSPQLQEIVFNSEHLDASAVKRMNKVATQMKKGVKWVKWGLLTTGIAVAAYTYIAAVEERRAKELQDIGERLYNLYGITN